MKTFIPIKVVLEDIEWEELRESLRSNGHHNIWAKIVTQYNESRENDSIKRNSKHTDRTHSSES